MNEKEILKYLEENPSVYTLLKMAFFSAKENKKYKIVGVIREPLLHSTGKSGFDFHYGYYFVDKNDQSYTLAKKEAFLLAELDMVSNAYLSPNKKGLRGRNCDLRKLKPVIPSYLNIYLSENEQKKVISELDKIKDFLISREYKV